MNAPNSYNSESKNSTQIQQALESIKNYDSWRLKRYLSIDDPSRGSIRTSSGATFLKFDDVGYFNRIYNFGPSNLSNLEQITGEYLNDRDPRFRFGVELIPNSEPILDSANETLTSAGFVHAHPTARLGLDLSSHPSINPDVDPSEQNPIEMLPKSDIEFRHPEPNEYSRILDLYLNGFQAPTGRHDAAKRNMQQLFDQPELITWCAFHKAQPVALGMLHVRSPFAVFAAGVTHPKYRKHGIHHSLIQMRIMHAKSIGCTFLYTWCDAEGQSFRNLLSHGFKVLRIDRPWKLPPNL